MAITLSLSLEEIRVLGVLIEKQRTTPEYYPMTVNAITSGCNQKTSRDPVVSWSATQVMRILDDLHKKRLVGTTMGDSSRSARYWHALEGALEIEEDALSVLSCLMLRGAQTPGEIRLRTQRMYPFEDVESVEKVLLHLASEREIPLVADLGKRPGQKETRYRHTLGGFEKPLQDEPASEGDESGLEDRLNALVLRLEKLEQAFESFRRQFE